MTFDTKFAAGVREQLVDTAAGITSLAKHTHRTRLALGLAAGAVAAGLLTAGAIIATGIPGEHIVTGLGSAVTQSHTGTATVELGTRPQGANSVSFSITCTSAGVFSVTYADTYGPSGTEWECSDTPGLNDRTTDDPYDSTVPVGHVVTIKEQALATGETAFVVATDATTTWTISARYANSVTTDWGVNANGQTYGVPNEKGFPDLEAVADMDGNIAYIYSAQIWAGIPADLPENATQQEIDAWNAEHADDVTSIPAYKSDGVTIIGEWVTGGDDAGLKLLP
jgi:hypothetical protein